MIPQLVKYYLLAFLETDSCSARPVRAGVDIKVVTWSSKKCSANFVYTAHHIAIRGFADQGRGSDNYVHLRMYTEYKNEDIRRRRAGDTHTDCRVYRSRKPCLFTEAWELLEESMLNNLCLEIQKSIDAVKAAGG